MTTPKPAEVRRHEILDAAEHLFVSHGYEDTSVSRILDAVGIAKGTFYHHFASKEAVMDAIIDRYVQAMSARGQQVLSQPGLGPQQRFLAAVMAMQVQPGEQEEMLSELNRPQNVVFHQRSLERTMQVAVPVLTEVVRDGIEAGAFRTEYPEQAIELILLYTAHVIDELDPADPSAPRTLTAFVHHIELLLGAEPGSMGFLLELLQGTAPDAAPHGEPS